MTKILETIIGLEVHVQLKTESKMFCSCRNASDGSEPNTHICPVCMGLVGTLPSANKKAVQQAILTGLALRCKIAHRSKWDRKNYFYPDLPKGYQISQYDEPLAKEGEVEVLTKEGEFTVIGINRVHLEEDAAKLIHTDSETLVDFNRAGVPLLEIVTKPDLRSTEDAEIFLRELRRIVRYIGVSDADMEKGRLRCDASISMRPVGENRLYPRTEIKNLNSFKMVREALDYESDKQRWAWEHEQIPDSAATVLWDDKVKATQFMRDKEYATDYRYMPEPDIPELIMMTEDLMGTATVALPVLPAARLRKYLNAGISNVMAIAALEKIEDADFLDAVLTSTPADSDLQKIAIKNFFRLFPDLNIGILDFLKIARSMRAGTISSFTAKKIFESIKADRFRIETLPIEDSGPDSLVMLETIVTGVIEGNPKIIAEYKAGKKKAINVLINEIINKSDKRISPKKIHDFLLYKLK